MWMMQWIVSIGELKYFFGKTSKASSRIGNKAWKHGMSSIYINLPSQSGNKVYKWLFPSIRFYCFDASYDLTHGSDPVICESSSIIPKGTEVRWALVTTAQLSSAEAAAAAAAGVDTGVGLGINLFSTALLHLEHRQVLLKVQMEKKASTRKSTIQSISGSNLENVQHWLKETWNESDTNHLLKEVTVR